MSHPTTTAAARNPPNIIAPVRSCARGSSRSNAAKTAETRKENRTSTRKWLFISRLFPSHRNVERVEDDEEVQQAGDDQERVAVLVGNSRYRPAARAHHARDEPWNPDAHVGDRFEEDERLGRLERKNAPFQQQAGPEHREERQEEHSRLLPAAEPEMTRAGNRPRCDAHG